MSHHEQNFSRIPEHLVLDPQKQNGSSENAKIRLLVKGQGTTGFNLTERLPFHFVFSAPDTWGSPAFKWVVDEYTVALLVRNTGRWNVLRTFEGEQMGLDLDPLCQYWFSIDGHDGELTYGKGEMRKGTVLASYRLNQSGSQATTYEWLKQVDHVEIEPAITGEIHVLRDPVTIDPPLRVLPSDKITMDDMAHYRATVAANLTPECGMLYANVAGEQFKLNTPDFPNFSDAIEWSIKNPNGWCHKKLKEKASEFGKPNPDETYLRITMGVNQGESPGIPFVMEIWPPGHYSPIHNHAGANAIIKVLHGSIHVSLFSMLSPYHQKPFASADFNENEVTWITPTLNQTHQLKNVQLKGPTCITIQCYMYPENNLTHYPYFDYIEENNIGHFTPNSDMGFLEFKETMRREWKQKNNRKRK